VKVGGTTSLTGSVPAGEAWIKGNTYTSGATTPKAYSGQSVKTSRSDVLVNSTGSFYTISPPTYEDIPASQVVNVKDHSVKGDGMTDDTVALQAVINSAAAASQILFFPAGSYIITDTIKVPAGSRLQGEAWSQLLASGSKFADAKNPHVMVQVGSPGDKGMSGFIL
jgi:glucan 1,3-beta-glucosidase